MTTQFNVAIVGGGIAGLYAAYRLRQAWESDVEHEAVAERLGVPAGEPLTVAILEQSPTSVGGRARNVELPYPGGSVIAEVGAMRFTTRQRLIRRLLADLKVRTLPFEGDGFSTRYYLRGKHFSAENIEQNDEVNFPYTLREEERGKTPTDLLSYVLKKTLAELTLNGEANSDTLLALEKLRGRESRDTLTHPEWAAIQEHALLTGTVRLENIGMWNLIHHYLGSEAAQFVEDGFGYESIIGNWNVSDAIPWFIADFSPGQRYETVDKGFGHAIACLCSAITKKNDRADSLAANRAFKCTIFLNARATEIALEDSLSSAAEPSAIDRPRYKIKTENVSPEYKHQCQVPDEVTAGSVILALPQRPLQNLDVKALAGEGHKKWVNDLAVVRPHRLAKIVQAYRDAWWRGSSPPGAGSRVFTDLPLRQVYYFDREWLEERGRYQSYNANGTPVEDAGLEARPHPLAPTGARQPEIGGLVVAYLDGHHASFWRFITAVQRIHDLTLHLEQTGTTSKPDHAEAVKLALARERDKRQSFGKRVWGWLEPSLDLYSKNVDDQDAWTAANRATHLYFHKYGLYERASTKMTHILRDLHANQKNASGDRVTVPDPVAGAYVFWDNFAENPMPEAGWHTWEPGVKSAAVMEYMVQPFKDHEDKERDVFVCGEAYSSEQGWIEGALKSVEMVMDRLGIMLPDEVKDPDAPRDLREKSDAMRDYVGLRRRPSDDPPPLRDAVTVRLSDTRSIVFLSGQIGFTPPAAPADTTIESQTTAAIENLLDKLAKVKGQPADIVAVRVFLQSMNDYHRFNQVYTQKLQLHDLPARTAIAVRTLPYNALVEIDAVAVIATASESEKAAK